MKPTDFVKNNCYEEFSRFREEFPSLFIIPKSRNMSKGKLERIMDYLETVANAEINGPPFEKVLRVITKIWKGEL